MDNPSNMPARVLQPSRRGVSMKKLMLLSIAVIVLFSYGCDSMKGMESDFVIKITGTDSLKFNGHYSFIETGGVPKPVNVSGTVPTAYKGKAITVACLFRNTSEKGSFKVEITKDGKTISEASSDIPYGIVTLKTPLPDKNTILSQILKKVLGE
jgi:hypothetical protein